MGSRLGVLNTTVRNSIGQCSGFNCTVFSGFFSGFVYCKCSYIGSCNVQGFLHGITWTLTSIQALTRVTSVLARGSSLSSYKNSKVSSCRGSYKVDPQA